MKQQDQVKINQLSEAAGALALHSVAEHVRGAMDQAYKLGFEAGYQLGVDEGRGSASGLITGLRSLLGQVEGVELLNGRPFAPAPIAPTSRGNERGGEMQIPERPITQGPCPHNTPKGCNLPDDVTDCRGRQECNDLGPTGEFDLNTATGEIKIDPAELAAGLGLNEAGTAIVGAIVETFDDDQVLGEHPAANYPGYMALIEPLSDCELCQGFGVIEGELYGAPCALPCQCLAGDQVKLVAEKQLAAGELAGDLEKIPEVATPSAVKVDDQEEVDDENDGICFRIDCVKFDQGEPNGCRQWEHVWECEHRQGPEALKCGNTKCTSYNPEAVCNCYAITDMVDQGKALRPVTSCSASTPIAGPSFDPDQASPSVKTEPAAELTLCCQECNLEDPDCASCPLPDKAETSAPAELPKCVNRNCTATGRNPKEACIRLEGADCRSFAPIESCTHDQVHHFNGESGSLACGLCGGAIQQTPRVTPGLTSQLPEGVSQGAPGISAEEEKWRRLQEKCKHPDAFIETIAGRGEVCTLCNLVLTPESLSLFTENVGSACCTPENLRWTKVLETGERRQICIECKNVHQTVAVCTHPEDLRFPEPDRETGGRLIRCAECQEILERFDADRRPIPREEWPENKEAGKIVEIASGAAAEFMTREEIRKHGFRPAEIKILKAGFTLVRYYREEKKVIRTCDDPRLGWFPVGIKKTYADAERLLASELENTKTVEVLVEDGSCARKSEQKLREAGFEFYRKEYGSEGVNPKIKQGSKNWGMHSRYKTDAELDAAWKKLMTEDPLALEG